MVNETHKSFLDRFRGHGKRDFDMIDLAYDIAKYGHRGQFRESGERYFEHLRSVALIIADELHFDLVDVIVPALLHDILEDSFILSKNRIEMIFGIDIARITRVLTKPKKNCQRFKSKEERISWYYSQILNGGHEAKIIKLADRLHNLRTLGACSQKKRDKKIQETKKFILPIIDSLENDFPEFAAFFRKEIGSFLL